MRLSHIAGPLRSFGLTVVEEPGWSTRGYLGRDLSDLRGVLWHHTATASVRNVKTGLPTRNVLINGHGYLPGPLCQIGLARDGAVHLIAAGLANHAGQGVWPGIPQDTGNWHLVGVEMESSGLAPWDWTDDQIRVAPHLGAALGKILWGTKTHWQIGHMEYARVQGKIDPAGWPGGMDGLRASINKVMEGTPTPAPVKPDPAPVIKPIDPPAKLEADRHWVVDPGDTLYKIARYYGDTPENLAVYNGVKADSLKVGEWIWPRDGYGTWKVDPGDTLYKIVTWCQKNWSKNITVNSVAYANGLNNPDKLTVGQRLQIK